MKCLWIARELPFPINDGDRIYSSGMGKAIAIACGDLTMVGIQTEGPAPASETGKWQVVPGGVNSKLKALLNIHPLVAATHQTSTYKHLLDRLFQEPWDAIIFNHYASGWALKQYLKTIETTKTTAATNRAVTVYLAHNHEEAVLGALARESSGSLLKRLALWQNYRKARALERFMVNKVDIVSAITAEDAMAFDAQAGTQKSLVLTPGYSGAIREQRQIDANSPRRVIMLGSFKWMPKQENLRQFLTIADPYFAARNIALDIVGQVPAALLTELQAQVKATTFHGFVDDVAPLFDQARIAVVPEVIGGGFKLKFLDYIFARMPVATLTDAAAGLDDSIRSNMLCCTNLQSLVASIADNIERVDQLNRMQESAFQAARQLFRWEDRGQTLFAKIITTQIAKEKNKTKPLL